MTEEFKQSCFFIDTNIFLRFLLADNAVMHEESASFLTEVGAGRVRGCTGSVVIAELYWVLLKIYHLDAEDVLHSVAVIGSIPKLESSDAFHVLKAVKLAQKHNVKFADCIIASNPLLQSGKMAIISYDKDFDKLGVKRLEPKDII